MLSQVQPGMIIAKSVFNASGEALLVRGTILTEHYIKRMRELEIYAVYIEHSLNENVDTPEILREETRRTAISKVEKIFSKMRSGLQVNCEEIQETAKSIVNEVLNNKYSMVHLTDIRTADAYTFGHSVNVCTLSVMIGAALGSMDKERLDKLAMGALLHDIGKVMVPKEILNKPGKLTDSEWKTMQQHSLYGFEILRKDRNLSIFSDHVAFQHHERFDCSGYPRGLASSQIHEFARITAIADVYDALTSERAYNNTALLPHQAYSILQAGSGTHFDKSILQAFLERIAVYPVGCMVQLNNGDIGIVVNVRPKQAMHPTIRLLLDGAGHEYVDRPEINLLDQHTIFVAKVLDEQAVAWVEARIQDLKLLPRTPFDGQNKPVAN